MNETIQSFLNVLHLLTPEQVRHQHAILCVQLDEAGYAPDSFQVTTVNKAVMHRLYPQQKE